MKYLLGCSVICVIAWALFVFPFVSPLAAESPKLLFEKKCGTCHGTGLTAHAFAPTKYATSQWLRFFKHKRHTRRQDISPYITKPELEVIVQYLADHSADSDQPEAMGVR